LLTAVLGAGLAALVLVPAGLLWLRQEQGLRQTSEERAERRAADAHAWRARADQNFRAARAAVDELLERAAQSGQAAAANPAALRKRLLEDAQRYYDQLPAGREPGLEQRRSALRKALNKYQQRP
jgi:hypothetical protein